MRGAFLNGVLEVERAGTEVRYVVHVYERFHFVVVDDVYLADFVAGSEPVEEVKERNFRL